LHRAHDRGEPNFHEALTLPSACDARATIAVVRLLPLLVLLGACSGGGAKGGTTPGARDAGAGTGDAAKADPNAPLTAAECDAFNDHMVDLTEKVRVAADPTTAATPEEIAKVKASRREAGRARCLQIPRPVWQCAMKAQETTALPDCEKNAQVP
jgi:hypothetical protein